MEPIDMLNEIQKQTEPSKMSKREALDYLEDLVSLINGSIEALREEIEEQ